MTPQEEEDRREALAGEYVLGTLDAAEAARVRAALETDPALAAAVARAAAPRFWRRWALASTALAAGLAAFALQRPAPEPRLMTVLLTARDQPAFLVEAGRDGALRLAAVNDAGAVPPDRVRQLWALPVGATAPISLGLLPAEGRFTVAPGAVRPEPGLLIEITLEPPGGSPAGRPTGPVLFIGRLAPARGA